MDKTFVTMTNESVTERTDLFLRKEVAAIFGITHHQVWFWEKRGWITPSLYVGGRPRYSIEDIEACAAKMNHKHPSTKQLS